MEMLTRMAAEKPVVIFSKSSCGMSLAVESLIRGYGADPAVHDLDLIQNGRQIEAALVQMGCQPSVPVVFIGQNLVGGAREVMSLQIRNELVPLLMTARAIWVWNRQ